MPRDWNTCDECGGVIPLEDFDLGIATRRLVEPDNAFGGEKYETLCAFHAHVALKWVGPPLTPSSGTEPPQ